MHYFSKLLAVASTSIVSVALAHNHGGSRHADAHVHGAGYVNFAVEGKQLHIELEIPGFDILGFESVSTDAQRKQVSEALHELEHGDFWLFPVAAGCELTTASAMAGGEGDHKEHDDDHEDSHEDDDEEHHHDHGAHDDHGEGAQASAHMDFEATYVYECAQTKALNRISTNLFKRFPNSESLKVQGFTASGQTAGAMTRKQPEVRF
ncbi:ZrgA family zinc uptake protein [Endozoicomonas ascidiicola]|uniref:ZrgA family zinc uptake protein n=1 Tax=Endozoicomonas ascidiicola TaxID=1698521 RepID=UPI000835C9F2|nr:DUF2796 domain-containing protein [Endozoicomonas ascidiicola]